LLVMRLVITRSIVLYPGICNLPSATTKSALHIFLPLYQATHLRHVRLSKLPRDVVISQGGVVPFINPEVRPTSFIAVVKLLTFLFSCCPQRLARERRIRRRSRLCTCIVLSVLFMLLVNM
jgi:hypothetical protein